MSTPAPPPPPGAPLPPPSTPPGYSEYRASNWAPDLRRISGLATAITILLGVNFVATLAQLAGTETARNAARRYLAGGTQSEFTSDAALYSISQTAANVSQLAIVVLSIIWLRRIVGNHAKLGRVLRWSPGWAIGAWFLPPFLFVIPLLVLRESWRVSDPDAPHDTLGHSGRPGVASKGRENPWLYAWFAVYGLAPLIIIGITAVVVTRELSEVFGEMGGSFGGDLTSFAETLVDLGGLSYASSIVAAVACPAWLMVVRTLTARHTRFTGEATAR